MERSKAFVKLMRPRHTMQVVGIVAIISTASHGFSNQSLYACISAFFLSIAIFFLDDVYDYESDKIVHQERPIPRGLFTIRQAYLAGVIFLFMGVLSASLLVFYQFAIFLASAVIGIVIVVFNIKSILKAVLIAFLIWLLFPFSAFPDLNFLLFGLIVALPHVGGSIAKDFLHSRGDQIHGVEPPSIWLKYLASAAFFFSGAIVWLPKILNFVTWFYIPPILLTDVSCLILGVRLLKGHYKNVYLYGGIGMCSALTAFLLGGIY